MTMGSKVDAYQDRYSRFLSAIQAAVASDDRDRVVSLIEFPLDGLSKSEF